MQTTCMSSDHEQNTCEVSKVLAKTVGGVGHTLSIHFNSKNPKKK